MKTPDISNLQRHELEELQHDIEDRIRGLEFNEWKSKKHTKEEIVAMFTGFGFTVPKGVKIWKVSPRVGEAVGGYGMEVGKYEHSCHIDATDFIVLLVVSGFDSYVESFAELWLSDPVVI